MCMRNAGITGVRHSCCQKEGCEPATCEQVAITTHGDVRGVGTENSAKRLREWLFAQQASRRMGGSEVPGYR
jgi:hypothetical protein